MKRNFVFIILFSLLFFNLNSGAQTEQKKEKQKTDLTFTLKEPLLEKQNAFDLVKTAGIVGGGLAVGVTAIVIASQGSTGEKPGGSTDLPIPPDFPSKILSAQIITPLLWFPGRK